MLFKSNSRLGNLILVAIAVFAAVSLSRMGLAYAQIQRLHTRIVELERQDSIRKGINAAIRDQYQSIGRIREKAEEKFTDLQLKYGGLVDRGGSVFSFRSVPSIQIEEESPPIIFRVIVPEGRTVWLRYGVFPSNNDIVKNPHMFRSADGLAKGTAFQHEGVFQHLLPTGPHLISIRCEIGVKVPIEVLLDDRRILSTVYESGFFTYYGRDQAYQHEQGDREVGQRLPWLFSSEMYPQTNSEASFEPAPHACSIWLSEDKLDVAPFPH
ncbi:hypothetical protein [Stieleria varia]|uniref:Uncharacterized protein n=1 Tax=Stieleria varia TaxID=2528005 RepID=A0A5C6A0C4_9BACT|nr:hypothetical protein [Stieleria varia]TWT92770.1 hypothetical protein Pla52n_61350 [Stieleria varia]